MLYIVIDKGFDFAIKPRVLGVFTTKQDAQNLCKDRMMTVGSRYHYSTAFQFVVIPFDENKDLNKIL